MYLNVILSFLLIAITVLFARRAYVDYLNAMLDDMIAYYIQQYKQDNKESPTYEVFNRMRIKHHKYLNLKLWLLPDFIDVPKSDKEFWKMFYILLFRYRTKDTVSV
jgi:hypothetical protein